MACRLVGAKPLSEPMLEYYWLDRRNTLQLDFNQNSNIFIQENAFESVVCKMAAILSRPQCVNNNINLNNMNQYKYGLQLMNHHSCTSLPGSAI